ncbi:MAG: arginase [Tissierellia bacterium]|nr:arginase [Tissierellia bacterium]
MNPEINDKLSIIGCPLDMGASLRGARLGPEAIRLAGIVKRLEDIGYEVRDTGDIPVPNHLGLERSDNNLNYLEIVKAAVEELEKRVDHEMSEGRFPVVLGGDHAIAMGTIRGVLNHVENLGVLWFDAHGDINTDETTPSGNIHGMPVASLLGLGSYELRAMGHENLKVKKENIVYIGQRDLDAGERSMIKDLGIKVYTMHEVDYMGIKKVMEEAIEYLSDRVDGFHVSFDMDILDPEVAPGTGTKVPGGMAYREAHLCLELLAKTKKVVSCEFVEVNPILDVVNKTAEAAVALSGSLLGEWLI